MDVETVVGQPALEGHRVVGTGVGCVRVSALREKSGPRMTASGACASMAIRARPTRRKCSRVVRSPPRLPVPRKKADFMPVKNEMTGHG